MSLHRCLCCAALCLTTAAAGLAASDMDSSVLVQSVVQAHSELRARQAPAGLAGVLDAAVLFLGQSLAQPVSLSEEPQFPNADQESVELTRTMTEHMTGAYVTMVAARSGCSNCPFTWGDKVDLQSVVHLPENIRKDDKVHVAIDVGMEASNGDSYFYQLFGGGEPLKVQGLCGICGGSCHLKSARAGDNFALTFPTIIRDAIACSGNGELLENVTDVIVLDKSMFMPFDSYALQLTGHLNVSMAVVREQRSLASSTLALKVKPPAAAPPKKAMDLVSTTEKSASLPGFLQLLLDSVLGEESSEVNASSDPSVNLMEADPVNATLQQPSQKTMTGADPVNAIITKLVVHKLENEARNVSISSREDCTPSGNSGSVACIHKIGAAPSHMSTSVHLASTFEPGDYMVIRADPKVRGPLGQFKRFTESLEIGEFEVPLCGGESIEFEYRTSLRRYTPPPCGFYSLDLDMPNKELRVPLKVRLPALQVFDKFLAVNKYLPLEVFPPMSVDVHLQLFHRAADPIMDVEFKMALDYSSFGEKMGP